MKQAKKGNQAEQAFFAASQEYEQNAADIDRYKKGTKALADAVEEAVKEFNKSLEAARATRAEIGKDEAVHGVNVDAANTIKRIKEGEIIQAGGAPDNPLSRSVVSDIQAMEALGADGRKADRDD
jgi:biopolymer transport protein ExbB/TolQ